MRKVANVLSLPHCEEDRAGRRGLWLRTVVGKSIIREVKVTAGIYAMVCVRKDPHGVWPGAALTVED